MSLTGFTYTPAPLGGNLSPNTLIKNNPAPSVSQPAAAPKTAAAPANNTKAVLGVTTPPAVGGGGGIDPAVAAQNAKIQSALDTGLATITATGEGSGQTAATNFTNQGNQVFGQLAQGQNAIDLARKQIGMNQINSIRSLNDTIRQGLHGGEVSLSNSNALDSSAADAISRAYSNYGNVQTNSINNQAAVGNEAQDVQQENLGIQKTIGLSNLKAFRDGAVQDITTQTQVALDNLKQYIAIIGGDGGQVNADAIKAQILGDANAKLSAIDTFIQGQINGVQAKGASTIGKEAYSGTQAGTVPSGPGLPFQIDQPAAGAPADQGAPNSLIPLALKPRSLATA